MNTSWFTLKVVAYGGILILSVQNKQIVSIENDSCILMMSHFSHMFMLLLLVGQFTVHKTYEHVHAQHYYYLTDIASM